MFQRLPTIGELVHFRQNDRCYAARVVHVWSHALVNLYVYPTGAIEPVPGALSAERVATSVPFSSDIHGRDWSWHWATAAGAPVLAEEAREMAKD